MKAVVNRILENNLSELKGLSLEGEIPVTEEFVNDLIKAYMESNSGAAATVPSGSPTATAGIDFSQILNALDTKELKIELKEKLAVIKINAKKF